MSPFQVGWGSSSKFMTINVSHSHHSRDRLVQFYEIPEETEKNSNWRHVDNKEEKERTQGER